MIAAGVNPNAKGMAYEAPLMVYDMLDNFSEIALAANNGMLVSNHSYGAYAGWIEFANGWFWFGDVGVSATEDYKFGFYDHQAVAWDTIAHLNPHHLICNAAGNSRGLSHNGTHTYWDQQQNPASGNDPRAPNGNYDCIHPLGVAKNILTVGGVHKIPVNQGAPDQIKLWVNSSCGPTDDGRIKPDIVCPAVNLYSASPSSIYNNAYDEYTGTSAATAVASGALILLQEQYHRMHGRYMSAASLKGITIHTANEAGKWDGPDYEFGWGLLNIHAAASLISYDSLCVREETLMDKDTFSQVFNSSGNHPVRVTICWTDVPGTPVAPAVNPPNRMLVNDLDLRLVRLSDSMVFYPYILDPALPDAAAGTGDNDRDNVEQIYIATPPAGDYKVVVAHKNDLDQHGVQHFSLITSGFTIQAPIADFQAAHTAACPGDTIYFSETAMYEPETWRWTFEGANISSSILRNPKVVYSAPGQYKVKLYVENQMGGDSLTKENFIGIYEVPSPNTITGNTDSRIYQVEEYSVRTAGNGSTCRWWVENGTFVSGSMGRNVTVEWGSYSSGRIGVQETNEYGCKSDTAFLDVSLEWATGIRNDDHTNGLMLYPNPASGKLHLVFHMTETQILQITLINPLGQKVYAKSLEVPVGATVQDIDISGIAPGIYQLTVDDNNWKTVHRIQVF